MKHPLATRIGGVLLLAGALLLCACSQRLPLAPPKGPALGATFLGSAAPTLAQAASEPPLTTLTLLAAGDNLIHDALYNQAHARAGGNGYDFLPMYALVGDKIAAADVAFINQETMMAASRPPASYPAFNSPPQLAGQLAALGFDVVNLANNHMLDQGQSGLLETIGLIDSIPALTRIGAYRDAGEKGRIGLVEKNGIALAFVGSTYYTNAGGTSLGADNILYSNETGRLKGLLAQARQQADAVVLSIHFGNEGVSEPIAYQYDFARQMCEDGADLVLGHHPHVIQPIERYQTGDGRVSYIFYSLGNFVSAQRAGKNLLGLMPEITFSKHRLSGRVRISGVRANPVVTHYNGGFGELAIHPLEGYTTALADAHGVRRFDSGFSLPYLQDLLQSTIDSAYLGQ